ncbi:MAG: SLBB domain-containing protein [Sulfuricella sp.]
MRWIREAGLLLAMLVLPFGVCAESSGISSLGASAATAAAMPGGLQAGLSAAPLSTPQITSQSAAVAPTPAGKDADSSQKIKDASALPFLSAHNEFQDFVAVTVGKTLPMFGYDLFQGAPSTFAPVDRIPVTADYVVGPGDEILIRGWGQVDIDFHAVVDRNGMIFIPRVGEVNVAGIKYQDLPGYLKTAVGRVFRNFDLNVSLGQLRSIQVLVVGQARRPGTYTVSSLSTLVSALFASGGPSGKGTMRRIELKRDGKVVTEFDLYDLLAKGDKSKDVRLLPGDVIYIPPIGKLAAVAGSVNVPAIYELKDKTTLGDLIGLAGGLTTTAAGQNATVERIEGRKHRIVAEFPLDAAGMKRLLQDGDLVTVFAISPRFDNAVTLRGNVAAPLRYPYREGMRVKDLIPGKDALITPDYWLRKNLIVRSGTSGEGQLRNEFKRSIAEVNWDYAVVERLNKKDLTTTLIPFNLGKAVLENDPKNNILLQPGDVVTIFSKADIHVPEAKQTKYVRLEGELQNAGVYSAEPGETLRQLVARVGGLTPNAYLYGAEFTRESTRITQQKKMDEALDRMERDMERSTGTKAQNVLSPEEAAGLKAQAESQRLLLARLRKVKATGRIVLEIPPEADQLKALPDLVLEDGDRLYIPAASSTVTVLGSVYNENSFIYKSGKRLSDYLAQAGGATSDGDKSSIYVMRADGSVMSKRQFGGWLSSFEGQRLMPGDTVVVPEETDKVTWMKEIKDWTQILYQFGLGAAALKVLK